MILVTGYSTTIMSALRKLTDETMIRLPGDLGLFTAPMAMPLADRYVYAAGLLHSKPLVRQDKHEINASLMVNFISAVRFCESALRNPNARVCVIGSQSGVNGSYDEMYAGMKAALHCYVVNRQVEPTQSISLIVPGIIGDSGMTQRRSDYPDVLKLRPTRTAAEVAQLVHDALYKWTGTTVRPC